MMDQMEAIQEIGVALECIDEEGTSLKDIITKALPNVDHESLKGFFSFLVDKKAVKDWDTKVYKGQDIRIVPEFAGG